MKPTLVADCVLINGHVIDPANGLDGPAEVAIEGARIVAVGRDLAALPRKKSIDVAGAVVCPDWSISMSIATLG
jgi:dihydroorotase